MSDAEPPIVAFKNVINQPRCHTITLQQRLTNLMLMTTDKVDTMSSRRVGHLAACAIIDLMVRPQHRDASRPTKLNHILERPVDLLHTIG